MCLLVDVEEAAERLEELIELARRGEAVLLCRGDRPIAVLSAPVVGDARSTPATGEAGIDAVWDLAKEGRREAPPAATSEHGDFYDESGSPR
jgi:antitoxin (DNA-binding transcriptional repressor) of toxin-antitoxin stability system